ncbi:hypothetical protein KCP77_22715 [Salmonella enterica subsp. enterica]|nr:hypothetical protein KCP77_22715 [Salmonella enterica subsp. enterica]
MTPPVAVIDTHVHAVKAIGHAAAARRHSRQTSTVKRLPGDVAAHRYTRLVVKEGAIGVFIAGKINALQRLLPGG